MLNTNPYHPFNGWPELADHTRYGMINKLWFTRSMRISYTQFYAGCKKTFNPLYHLTPHFYPPNPITTIPILLVWAAENKRSIDSWLMVRAIRFYFELLPLSRDAHVKSLFQRMKTMKLHVKNIERNRPKDFVYLAGAEELYDKHIEIQTKMAKFYEVVSRSINLGPMHSADDPSIHIKNEPELNL